MKLSSRVRPSTPLFVLLFVLGFGLVYSLSWIQLYFQPHPYVTASEWIFENVPAGSVLAGPHWDDRLPCCVPGKDGPRTYAMEGQSSELPFYERDTPEKLNLVLKRTARADYIIFPTPRISDSIPRVPDEYPLTTAYLQLLWSEKLGFTFEKSFKNRPTFLDLSFNDDLADESFSVYDHPKVVIFKNVDRLTEEQMRERIMGAEKFGPLPGLNEILLMDRGGWVAPKTIAIPGLLTGIKAGALIVVIAVSFWILTARLFSFLPDRGLGLSFLLGVSSSAALSIVLALSGVASWNQSSARFVAGLIIFAAAARVLSSSATREICAGSLRRFGLPGLASFLLGIAIVIGMKVVSPELFLASGEKERFALDFFAKSERVLPNYSWGPLFDHSPFYVGHMISGWFMKVVGLTGRLSYEFGFVLIGGVIGGALFSLILIAVRKPLYSLALTALLLLPAVSGVHQSYNGVIPGVSAPGDSSSELMQWLSANVKGAPLVVESCDLPTEGSVASQVGFPQFVAREGSDSFRQAVQSACSLGDPEAAFKAMLAYGVRLLIVPQVSTEGPEGRGSALQRFLSRPDLFAPLYNKEGAAVFAPAFSEYFPRAFTLTTAGR